jgi:PAS domain S-box-containing protein
VAYDGIVADTQAVMDSLIAKEVEVQTTEGKWYTMRTLPYRTLDNVIEGAVITFFDITEAKKTQEALRESEQRRRLAQEAANSGTWEWNLLTNENTWSEEMWHLYGLEPNSCIPSLETWLQSVHPDDRTKVERAVQEAASRRTDLDAEWRALNRDGEDRWLMCRGKPFRDATGQVIRYAGVLIDITGRKRMEETLQKAFDQIKTLRGIVPICASCKKIRDDQGFWNQVEVYIRDHTEAEFSHSVCPECMKKLYPEFEQDAAGSAPQSAGDPNEKQG